MLVRTHPVTKGSGWRPRTVRVSGGGVVDADFQTVIETPYPIGRVTGLPHK
jgi:hypothetical protein